MAINEITGHTCYGRINSQNKMDVQLEWDCNYRLYMVALTRSSASPVSEF